MQYFKLKFENKTPQKLGRFLLRNGFSKRALTNSQHNGGNDFSKSSSPLY